MTRPTPRWMHQRPNRNRRRRTIAFLCSDGRPLDLRSIHQHRRRPSLVALSQMRATEFSHTYWEIPEDTGRPMYIFCHSGNTGNI